MATLIGDSGHARDIQEAWFQGEPGEGLILVGHHKDITDVGDRPRIIIGINDPWIRARVAMQLGVDDLMWIHPRAYLGPDCKIGVGTHINFNAALTRATIGQHTTIGPGVTIGGDVTIGDRVNVCMGALIGVRHPGETVTIGDDATIGAGAVVLHDIPAGETWVGNPARKLR